MSISQRLYGTIFMAVALTIGAQQTNAQVQTRGGITSYTVQPGQQGAVDFINAKPMPLPQNSIAVDAVQSTINALTRPQENAIEWVFRRWNRKWSPNAPHSSVHPQSSKATVVSVPKNLGPLTCLSARREPI